MNQKVWVISDEYWKEPAEPKGDDERPSETRHEMPEPTLSVSAQKNPALAFSLSMLLWGGGQIYLRSYRTAALFFSGMPLFYAVLSMAAVFRNSFVSLLADHSIPMGWAFGGGGAFLLCGLLLWGANALHAYGTARSLGAEPLPSNRVAGPLLCSLLFPGWGQFLNGQPRKGAFFLLCGITGVFAGTALLLLLSLWPLIQETSRPLAFEIFFLIFGCLIPLTLIMWVVSIYDAFRVSWNFLERRRRKLPGYRMHGRPFGQELIPRSTAVLTLLLSLSVGMHLFPKGYYLDLLYHLRTEMLNSHMELLPEIANTLIHMLA